MRSHARRKQADKRARQADLHFKTQALTFVDRRAARPSHRLPEPVARQVLFIAAVAGFMHRAPETADKTVFPIARGEARVFRRATAKRMSAFVETARIEIEAEQLHRLQAHRILRGFGERPKRRDNTFARLFFTNLSHQRRQPGLQIAEQLVHHRAGHAGFMDVHQGVVHAESPLVGQMSGFFAFEREYFAEILKKPAPIIGGPLRLPRMFAARIGERLRLHE